MTEAVQIVGGAVVLVWLVWTFPTWGARVKSWFAWLGRLLVAIMAGWLEATSPYEEPTWVYYFFDEDGNLLYVGITNDIRRRWAQHAEDKPWWHLVARKERVLYESREEAEKVEAHQIRTHRPMFNRALNGWLAS